LLLVAADHLVGGLDQGVEGVDVERLGIFLVAAHGPRPDQRRFRLAILDHGDGPAVVVVVFNHARGPAVALPQAIFLHQGVVICIGVIVTHTYGRFERKVGVE
jgi:hypothetical protein